MERASSFGFWHWLLCWEKQNVLDRALGFTLACNGSRLGEGGELEVQMFMLVQKLIRIPNVQI